MFYIFVVQHKDGNKEMFTIAMCRDCLIQLTDRSCENVNRMMGEHECKRTMLSKSVSW